MPRIDFIDIIIVALTIMAEAEGEPYEGKVAVGAVIYNRARNPSWWGSTPADVCLTPKQFSCWNDDNPRRKKIGEWDLNDPVFAECFRAAIEAIHRDPTQGADHYFAHDVVLPSWADVAPQVVIDGHTFISRGAT